MGFELWFFFQEHKFSISRLMQVMHYPIHLIHYSIHLRLLCDLNLWLFFQEHKFYTTRPIEKMVVVNIEQYVVVDVNPWYIYMTKGDIVVDIEQYVVIDVNLWYTCIIKRQIVTIDINLCLNVHDWISNVLIICDALKSMVGCQMWWANMMFMC